MSEKAHNGTAPPDSVIELVGVWKTFRQRQRSEKLREVIRGMFRPQYKLIHALRNVDLRVCRGEVVAYAGPNGAGKSTTVKMLSGMLAPTAGTVRVAGMDPVRQRVRYVGRIATVFGHRTELWWDQPVAATFEWKRVVWNIPRGTYDRMLDLVKQMLGLQEFYHSMARELSLGQRMRADLGLAMLHQPEILFLDEPTLGLDVLARQAMLDMITTLGRMQSLTVVVTSHDMEELERLAGRVVLINEGQIAFDGTFDCLRRGCGDRRRLILETTSPQPPALEGATPTASQGCRHEYVFDAAAIRVGDLLAQAGAGQPVLDVETHRLPISDVIAYVYRGWQAEPGPVSRDG